jgi:hypothetical protein
MEAYGVSRYSSKRIVFDRCNGRGVLVFSVVVLGALAALTSERWRTRGARHKLIDWGSTTVERWL